MEVHGKETSTFESQAAFRLAYVVATWRYELLPYRDDGTGSANRRPVLHRCGHGSSHATNGRQRSRRASKRDKLSNNAPRTLAYFKKQREHRHIVGSSKGDVRISVRIFVACERSAGSLLYTPQSNSVQYFHRKTTDRQLECKQREDGRPQSRRLALQQ